MKVLEWFGFYEDKAVDAKPTSPVIINTPSAPPSSSFNKRSRKGLELSTIYTFTPKKYEEACEITESLKNNVPVILNIHELNNAEALRIIDFAAGAVKALDGKIRRVTKQVFIVAPYGVELDGAVTEAETLPLDIAA
jgi:cell division inhibitor SepF